MKSLRYMIPTMVGSILIGTAIGRVSTDALVGPLITAGLIVLISLFFINEE